MSHPPIPPNCPYFGVMDESGEDAFQCSYMELWGLESPVMMDSKFWPPIIAAVARCAWLDEEAKLEDALDRIKAPYPEPWDSVPTWRERNAVHDNAEAWRVWGESRGAAKS